jgi:YhcH/YjgK/YiaL family protein
MIKDRIDNAEAYGRLGGGIARAMHFLRTTDCTKLEPGKHEIDDQRVFAVVQRYLPKPLEKAGWEAHHRYIDVQYIAEGRERMGYTALVAGLEIAKPYDPHTDLIFYETTGDLLVFQAGEFAIFTPQDVHAPSLALDSGPGAEVLKVVVKVRVDERHPGTGF